MPQLNTHQIKKRATIINDMRDSMIDSNRYRTLEDVDYALQKHLEDPIKLRIINAIASMS